MQPIVICSILEYDAPAVLRRVEQAPAACALLEVRADRLRASDVDEVLARIGRPAIVTVRSPRDGGAFDGSEDERRAILTRALGAGAAFVDVEWEGALADLASGPLADRVILSHHGAPCDGTRLRALVAGMRSTRAARIKIVPRARSISDAQALRELLRDASNSGAPLAAFALGAAGIPTRILAPSWGSWATYGAAERGRETGEGQLAASELLEVHDVLRIGPATRRFALVGAPVGASPSPALHRAGYREHGIDAVFLPLESTSIEEVANGIAPGSALEVEALAVTIPLKEAAASRALPMDACASTAGAVNTVLVRDGRWEGHNTDGPAVAAIARRRIDPRGARVAIVGAGGTARAAGCALSAAGAVVTFFNRDPERARGAAAEIGGAAKDWDALPSAAWDILVQATPLGRRGEEIPLPRTLPGRVVIDAAYAQDPTPLVERARAEGLAVADGYELLVEQALEQHRLMTGRAPARAALEEALRTHRARGFGPAPEPGSP